MCCSEALQKSSSKKGHRRPSDYYIRTENGVWRYLPARSLADLWNTPERIDPKIPNFLRHLPLLLFPDKKQPRLVIEQKHFWLTDATPKKVSNKLWFTFYYLRKSKQLLNFDRCFSLQFFALTRRKDFCFLHAFALTFLGKLSSYFGK